MVLRVIFAAIIAALITFDRATIVQAAGELTGYTGAIFVRTVNSGFKFWAREGVSGDIPVVSAQPTKSNSVVAFDVFPKGTPTERVDNGFAWADICDGDLTTAAGTVCARIGARSDAIEFGSRPFGTAAAKPLWLSMNGVPSIIVDTDGTVLMKAPVNIAEDTGTCDLTREGNLSYSVGHFYGCNGTSWVRLD